MLERTGYLRKLTFHELSEHPSVLFGLRMCTAPPIARDRFVGLAGVPRALVDTMEKDDCLPPQMNKAALERSIQKIIAMVTRLVDVDIFTWLAENRDPTQQEVYRAATIVADRLCGANANPIIRNAQERRQLSKIKAWLEAHRYQDMTGKTNLKEMQPGTFAFRLNVPGLKEDHNTVNIPVDGVVMPRKSKPGQLPVMIEAKSAGDFTNTNKRRKKRQPRSANCENARQWCPLHLVPVRLLRQRLSRLRGGRGHRLGVGAQDGRPASADCRAYVGEKREKTRLELQNIAGDERRRP